MMVLSSLFKQKPMISVILTKDKENDNATSEFSYVETRLDELTCKIYKLKKQSKKVFECNKLDTVSAFDACCAKLKKEKCKAKKRKCMKDDSCNIEDFSCGDQLQLSGESDFDGAGECEDVAEDIECPCPEEEKCEEEQACGEEQAEEACQEEKEKSECEEEEEKTEEKDNDCIEVLTAEPKGSTYYLSQVELQKESVPKLSSVTSRTSTKTPVDPKSMCSLSKHSTKDTLEKESLVVPVITTTSARSLSKLNGDPPSVHDENTQEEHDSSTGVTVDTYPIHNELQVEMANVRKNPSVGSHEPIQSEKSGSKISTNKVKSKSSLQNSHHSTISGTKSKSLSNHGMSKGELPDNDHIAAHVQQVISDNAKLFPENKQPSIVYIVQAPSKKNLNSLTGEGVIHIDASNVFIQSGAPLIEKESSKSTSAFPKTDEIQVQFSEQEKKTSINKIESRVSFQQAEVIEFDDGESKLSLTLSASKEGLKKTSAICTNTLYDTSSKIIPNVEPTPKTFPSIVKISSLSQLGCDEKKKTPENSECDAIKKSQEQWVSECDVATSQAPIVSDCNTKETEQVQNVSTCDTMKISQVHSVSCDYDALNVQSIASFKPVKTSQVQIVSDCDEMKTSQVQFVSNCETTDTSQNQFVSGCETMKTSVDYSDSDTTKTAQVQIVASCEPMRTSQAQIVSSSDPLKTSQDQLASNDNTMEISQTQIVSRCEATKTSEVQFVSSDNDTTKTSEVQFPSCEPMKISQVQIVSNCETVKNMSEDGMNNSILDVGLATVETPIMASISQKDESPHSISGPDIILRASPDPLNHLLSKPMEFEPQTEKTSLSEIHRPSMQVQPAQLSVSGFQQNQSSLILEMQSGELHTPMAMKTASHELTPDGQPEGIATESQTQVMRLDTLHAQPSTVSLLTPAAEAASNSMVKTSFTVLQNSEMKESLNYLPRQKSSTTSDKMESNESPHWSKISNLDHIKDSGGALTNSLVTNSSLGSETISDTSQQNETIAMFVDTNIEIPKENSQFLLIHCSKCKELCVAKILEKKQPPPDIWAGQGS